MKPILEARNIAKKYKIGERQKYLTLRDMLSKKPSAAKEQEAEFWALRDVSFDIYPGDSVGIIGRNGAGKSTLLKILSKITPPTEGTIKCRGRVASLLEVGTGFHNELTGRENIYLNGSILGLRKWEIDKHFDAIVDFSGVEKFLDTPLKRYSSGMQLRLAFAVAAHLEPEVLVIDEVLAVGDAEFQKKCLGKMDQVSKSGRTILFVSHQMNAVQSLCRTGILLRGGNLIKHTQINEIVSDYLRTDSVNGIWTAPTEGRHSYQSPFFNPLKMAIVDEAFNPVFDTISRNQDIHILIEGVVEEIDPALTVGFALFAETGELLFWSYQTDNDPSVWPEVKLGVNRFLYKIPANLLNEGNYRIELMTSLHYRQWLSQPGNNAPFINFEILGNLSESPYWIIKRPGLIAPILPTVSVNTKLESVAI